MIWLWYPVQRNLDKLSKLTNGNSTSFLQSTKSKKAWEVNSWLFYSSLEDYINKDNCQSWRKKLWWLFFKPTLRKGAFIFIQRDQLYTFSVSFFFQNTLPLEGDHFSLFIRSLTKIMSFQSNQPIGRAQTICRRSLP